VAATGQWGHDDGATGGGFLLLLSSIFCNLVVTSIT
jgi:hypothetical protein